MKKDQLARRLARAARISPAAAADQLDRVVRDILKRVRKGQSAALPGLGSFESRGAHELEFDFSPHHPARTRRGAR